MENIAFNIEQIVLDIKTYSQCVFYGWVLAKDGTQPDIRIRTQDGQTEVPCEINWHVRNDVRDAFPEWERGSFPGVEIIVKDIRTYLPAPESDLKIYAETNTEKVCIFETTFEAMDTEYRKESLLCAFDAVYAKKRHMMLRGWAYSKNSEVHMELINKKGDPVPFTLEETIREDVQKRLKLEKGLKIGYQIQIRREDLKDSALQLRIADEYTEKIYPINVRKFKFEESRFGRTWNTLGPSGFGDNIRYIKENGFAEFQYEIRQKINPDLTEYEIWRKQHLLTKREIKRQRGTKFAIRPKFSIVIPLYNTPLHYLEELIQSVVNQTYDNFQLCFADGSTKDEVGEFIKEKYGNDSRILYKRLKDNRGISENTNEAFDMADGDFIMLSDHDDVLTLDALYEMVAAINKNPDIDVLYTDEDKVDMDGKEYFAPSFKPDFSMDFLRSANYICHIFAVKKSIVDEVGTLLSKYDGAQDLDFILRCCEKAKKIWHVPKILYHWRCHPASTAGDPTSKLYAYEAGECAVSDHYKRLGIPAKVTKSENFGHYRTQFEIQGNPLVSVIISSADETALEKCIATIKENTDYKNYEILTVLHTKAEGGSDSARKNHAVRESKGEYLLFLDDCIEPIESDWLSDMLGYCQRPDVGVVGARLHANDEYVYHAGIVVGIGKMRTARSISGHRNHPELTYQEKMMSCINVSAVSGNCLLTKKELFREVGGMDETGVGDALSDVDYCLKVREKGLAVISDNFVELYHHAATEQDLSDVHECGASKQEAKIFRERWKKILDEGDPYYNPNLTKNSGYCSVCKNKTR